ncbi:unnamed protein product [Darwinula stevensoni]|uniref:Uncharacterized protein n=1 Tax=Darwinula stevensoni TaxID=69355 RepID=A0A7R9A8H5_9CRUS|nr:unnamed protein product [Darwinula stevensoni]CAG0896338.1 unnamed protein product [Darwinula stevensoni]
MKSYVPTTSGFLMSLLTFFLMFLLVHTSAKCPVAMRFSCSPFQLPRGAVFLYNSKRFSRHCDDYARGIHDYARGIHDHARGIHDHARGIHDHARGIHDHARGIHDYARSIHDFCRPAVHVFHFPEPDLWAVSDVDPTELHLPSRLQLEIHGKQSCPSSMNLKCSPFQLPNRAVFLYNSKRSSSYDIHYNDIHNDGSAVYMFQFPELAHRAV